jgi:hypothetical protein
MRFPYPPQDYDDITPNNDIFFVETRWKLRGHYVRWAILKWGGSTHLRLFIAGPHRHTTVRSSCVQLPPRF